MSTSSDHPSNSKAELVLSRFLISPLLASEAFGCGTLGELSGSRVGWSCIHTVPKMCRSATSPGGHGEVKKIPVERGQVAAVGLPTEHGVA